MLAPLKSQGASSVTAQQVLDQLNANDEFRGMNLDTDFIMDALKNVKGIRIEPDTDNGVMSIFFDEQSALR
ncbi:hypothetical protein, partial [Escherichia coli]|uniref:hypothetical protein n=1 Tax=Escherichia coli TaxID=562 RepID=UPI0019633AF4